MADTQINVVDEVTGEVVGHVPAAQAATLPPGLRMATPADEQAIAHQQQYGGLEGQLATAAAGVVHEGTLGFGTAALDAALPGYARKMAALSEVNPVASVIGRGIGVGANIAMLGGPTAALENQLAARGVGPVARVAGIGTLEGGTAGLGHGLSQAAVDNELNGEKLMASMLFGAGIGGTLGLGIGGTMSLIGKGAGAVQRKLAQAADSPGQGAAEQMLQNAFGHAPRSAVQAISEAVGDASAIVSGGSRDAGRALFSWSKQGRRARELIREADVRKPQIVDDIARGLDETESAWDVVSTEVRQAALKRDQVARVVRRDNVPDQALQFQKHFQRVAGTLDELDKTTGKWGTTVELRQAAQIIGDRIDKAAAKGARGLSADMYSTLDSFKRELGKHTSAAERVMRNKGTIKWQRRFDALDKAYHELRDGLEDVTTWGGAAEMQQGINRPLTDFRGARQKFTSTFMTNGVTRSKSNPWRNALVADRAKIESYVNNVLNPNSDLAHQALRTSLDARSRAAKAMVDAMDLSPAQRAAAQKLATESDALLKRVGDAEEILTASNQLRALEKGGPDSGLVGSALLGQALGGAPGGLLGMAFSAMMNPARTVRQMAAVEHWAGKWSARQSGAIKSLMKGGVKAPALSQPGAALTRSGRQKVEAVKGMLDKREEYRARRAALEQWVADRDTTRYAMEKSFAVLGSMPTATKAALDTFDRRNEYLLSTLPAVGSGMGRLFGRRREPGNAEVSSWMRRVRAIEDPATLLDDVSEGRVSREAVEAVKEVYPGIYQEMRTEVFKALGEMQASGETLPWQQRLQLGLMLEMPTDGTLEPQFIHLMQSMYAEQAQQMQTAAEQGPAPQAAKPLSEAFKTGSQGLEEM